MMMTMTIMLTDGQLTLFYWLHSAFGKSRSQLESQWTFATVHTLVRSSGQRTHICKLAAISNEKVSNTYCINCSNIFCSAIDFNWWKVDPKMLNPINFNTQPLKETNSQSKGKQTLYVCHDSWCQCQSCSEKVKVIDISLTWIDKGQNIGDSHTECHQTVIKNTRMAKNIPVEGNPEARSSVGSQGWVLSPCQSGKVGSDQNWLFLHSVWISMSPKCRRWDKSMRLEINIQRFNNLVWQDHRYSPSVPGSGSIGRACSQPRCTLARCSCRRRGCWTGGPPRRTSPPRPWTGSLCASHRLKKKFLLVQ